MNININRQNYSLLFLLIASVMMSLFYTPAYDTLSGDKEIYRYVGRLMLKGGVPYRDVFDHKPPLIFFLNYAGLLMGDWGQWFIDALLVLLATFLFFQLNKRYKLAFPWVLPLLFNLMIRDNLICIGMGFTREYTAIGVLLFFCVLMGKDRYRYYWLGLLSGLIFFMQQDQALQLLPFFIYVFLQRDDKLSFFARVLRIGAGFVTVLLPILLYFAWWHSLNYFWYDAFIFNFSWYTTTFKESFGDHLRRVKRVLDAGNYEVPCLVALTLGTVSLFFRHNNKRLLLACLAAVGLSIIPEFMGGRSTPVDFAHYYIPLSATLPILLFVVFSFAGELVIQDWKAQGIYSALACCSVFYTTLQHGTHPTPRTYDAALSSASMKYLWKHPPGDYQLYEFGNNDFVSAYNEFKIIGPSKWVYQHFWQLYTQWDKDRTMLQGIIDDLARHRTTYILDCTMPAPWFRDPVEYEMWHSFLVKNYEPVVYPQWPDDALLWKLKGTPE